MKKQRTGWMLLLVAVGASGAGFLLGLQVGGDTPVRSDGGAIAAREAAEYGWDDAAWEREAAADPLPVPAPPAPGGGGKSKAELIKPSELLDSLRRNADSARGQKMLIGMVADAAQAGGAMLPEIRRMLDEGVDIKFPAYKPGEPGYPSLRVALLAAAEATGAPEATRLIAEVAQTSESPVEVVFSAHMLDRLDALDPATAQRTLESIAKPLTKDQMKAMRSVLLKVIPAAAAADPAYAETFLNTHMRALPGEGVHPGLLAPVLDGLPMENARNIVLSSVNAADIPDRTKMLLAGRAAQRGEIEMLQDLRSAIESNTLPEKVTRSIASSSLGGASYNQMRNGAFQAIKQGDLKKAQALAKGYEARLAEAARTIQAARATGTKLPATIQTRSTMLRQRLNQVLDRLRHEYRKLEKQQAQDAKNK